MADTATITANVQDGSTINSNVSEGVTITTNVTEGVAVTANVTTGGKGDNGEGVPVGGTTGQVLAKATATDYDTEWVDAASGGGAVDSVNSQTGTVVLDADDIDDTSTTHKFVTASDLTTLSNTSGTNTGDQDLSSYATTAAVAAGYQPLDADLTALAALTTPATKLDGIEAGADVTDTANVTAAGALMDSEVTNLAQVKAFSSADYATAAQGATADSALQNIVEDTTPQLGGELDAQGNNISDLADVTFKTGATGGTVRTGTSAADKFELQAYDVDGSAYQKVLEVDAGNNPTLEVFTDTFRVWDSADETKQLKLDTSAIATGTTRTLSVPNSDVDLADFETTTELNARDTANRSRANHTGTQDHTTISDYDTELAGTANTTAFTPTADYHPATKKYVDDGITAAGGYNDEAAQDAIGTILTDSSEIDFTYNDATPSITASLVAGSIDETKLDTSVNASLDLADSATQPGDLATVATTGAYSDLTGTPTIPTVSDTAYDATSWNGNTDAPTKNAVRDKIESMGSGDVVGPASSTDTAVAVFDGTTGKLLKNSSLLYNEALLELSGMQDIRADNEIYGDALIATSGVYADTIYEITSGAGVTIDGVLVKDGEVDGVDVSTTYRTGGTDVALADGGTGASLTDPNADRIMFWDDSAGAVTWLTPSTGLTVSGTNMTVRTSSATQTGIVELATTAETTTATDTARAVTPAGIGAERSATATLTNKTLSTGSTIDANVTVTEVLKKVYPVGSIYTATVATNPATLFGFGTWAAYGEGRVIVGKAAAGTFGTAGATGGAETHTLTTTEMPVHTHTQNAHNHQYFRQRALSAESVSPDSGTAYASTGAVSDRKTEPYTYNATATNQNAGGGGAHNNLQPYIVAYLWERTA